MPSFVGAVLDEIRRSVQPLGGDLTEARERRKMVLDAAGRFEGVLRTFPSGSIAHGTALIPANDADCGLVLDRTIYPELGPEGDGVGSSDIVEAIRTHLRESLRDDHPGISYRVTKRAIYVDFGDDGPTVDLIVSLNRRSDPGLWIPRTDTDDWDSSHPEKHTELFLRANRATASSSFAKAVRLLKAWNNQHDVRPCSFNIEALALASIEGVVSLEDSALTFFEYAETDLKERLTPDPAGVSAAIKLPTGWSRDQASTRMKAARQRLEVAQGTSNDDDAAAEIKKAFPDFENQIEKVRLERQLSAHGTFAPGRAAGGVAIPVTAAKATRSWGSTCERR